MLQPPLCDLLIPWEGGTELDLATWLSYTLHPGEFLRGQEANVL